MTNTAACATGTPRTPKKVHAGFGSGQPHGWIEALTGRLERIIIGRTAQSWLNGEFGALPRNAAVIALPSWQWANSRINMGRKDVARDGGRLLMPIRVTWSPHALLVLPAGANVDVQWRAAGLGHSGTGLTTLRASRHVDYLADLELDVIVDHAGMPVTITADPVPGPKLKAHLRKLVEDGKLAHWEAIGSIEPFVTKAVRKASSSIAARINTGADEVVPLLDEHDAGQVADEMLYGCAESADTGKVSDVFRLIERCTEPGTFARVEPERYIRNTLWSAADSAVRRKVGDPFIGDKIRAVQAAGGYATIEELVAAYRELYPRDRLSTGRAAAALAVHAQPEVFSYDHTEDAFNEADDDHYPDFSDALVAVLDIRRERLASALNDPSALAGAAEPVKVAV